MDRNRVTSAIGIGAFAACLSIAVYIFVLVMILPPGGKWLENFTSLRGVYGPTILVATISYSQALEISGAFSFLGLFVYSYSKNRDWVGLARVLLSFGLPLVFFGTLIAGVVYTEIHLSWGEFWYGIKFANLNPQGFPWGTEQVAYNTCLIRGHFTQDVAVNCSFLNYDQLLYLSAFSAVVGLFLLWRCGRPGSDSRYKNLKSIFVVHNR